MLWVVGTDFLVAEEAERDAISETVISAFRLGLDVMQFHLLAAKAATKAAAASTCYQRFFGDFPFEWHALNVALGTMNCEPNVLPIPH